MKFNPSIAINVLIASSYFDEAKKLCEIHGKHGKYLKIQIEYIKNYNDALNYLS